MAASQTWREGASTRARRRAYWQRRLNAGETIICGAPDCGEPIHPTDDWDLGHHPRYPKDHSRQAPWHRDCNRRDGQATTTAKRNAKRATATTRPRTSEPRPGGSVFGEPTSGTASALSLLSPRSPLAGDPDVVEPAGFDADDPVWDRAPWLDSLREVPANATWPRYMTVPHPRAVGTYGPDLAANLLITPELRWFQLLWAYRVLEHDAEGHLVWERWIKSMARQLGKSWGVSELALWRVRQGERFGGAQDVLHIADRLRTAKEVQRRARTWAKSHRDLWTPRESNESVEIEYLPDGSRWLLRAADAVYSFTGSLGFADEAWKIKASVIEEGLAPTLVAREDGQLGLISTAHRMATSLMLGAIAAALEHLADGMGDLILLWSTPRSFDLDDVNGWRMASPYWDGRREKLIRGALERALRGEATEDPDEPDPIEAFRAQWLNQWPQRLTGLAVQKGEPLVDVEEWAARELVDPADGALTVVIEDDRQGGAAAAASFMRADGRVVVTGRAFGTLADAAAQAREWIAAVVGSRLLVGASLLSEPELRPMLNGRNAVGASELRTGLSLFRRAFKAQRLWHDEEAGDLTEQLAGARVVEGPAGLSLVAGRTDLVRAAVWAVQAVYDAPAEPRID